MLGDARNPPYKPSGLPWGAHLALPGPGAEGQAGGGGGQTAPRELTAARPCLSNSEPSCGSGSRLPWKPRDFRGRGRSHLLDSKNTFCSVRAFKTAGPRQKKAAQRVGGLSCLQAPGVTAHG